MAAKPPPFNIDDLVRNYLGGIPAAHLAREFGVAHLTIVKALQGAGVEIRGPKDATQFRALPPERVEVPSHEITRRYVEGESEKSLSLAFGVNRWTIRNRLLKAGIEIRGRSASNVLRMANPADRANWTRNAHLALGRGESYLADLLIRRGINVERQVPVESYNLDLASGRCAIEIHCSQTSPVAPASHVAERAEHLMDLGWDVLFVWVTPRHPLGPTVTDEVVAWLDLVEQDPSSVRQYRMIRGCGEHVTSGRGQVQKRSLKRTLSRSCDRA